MLHELDVSHVQILVLVYEEDVEVDGIYADVLKSEPSLVRKFSPKRVPEHAPMFIPSPDVRSLQPWADPCKRWLIGV
jgi:hypothetical protein